MRHLILGSLLPILVLIITNPSLAALPGIKKLNLSKEGDDAFARFSSRDAIHTETSKYNTLKIESTKNNDLLFVSGKFDTVKARMTKEWPMVDIKADNFKGAPVESMEIIPNGTKGANLLVRISEWRLPTENGVKVSQETTFWHEKDMHGHQIVHMTNKDIDVNGRVGSENTSLKIKDTFLGPTRITSERRYQQIGDTTEDHSPMYTLYASNTQNKPQLNMTINPEYLGLSKEQYSKMLSLDLSTIAKSERAFIQDYFMKGNEVTIKFVDEIDGKVQLRQVKLDIIKENDSLDMIIHSPTNLGSKALAQIKAKVTVYGKRTKETPGSTSGGLDMGNSNPQ